MKNNFFQCCSSYYNNSNIIIVTYLATSFWIDWIPFKPCCTVLRPVPEPPDEDPEELEEEPPPLPPSIPNRPLLRPPRTLSRSFLFETASLEDIVSFAECVVFPEAEVSASTAKLWWSKMMDESNMMVNLNCAISGKNQRKIKLDKLMIWHYKNYFKKLAIKLLLYSQAFFFFKSCVQQNKNLKLKFFVSPCKRMRIMNAIKVIFYRKHFVVNFNAAYYFCYVWGIPTPLNCTSNNYDV